VVGLAVALACLALYELSRPGQQVRYDHFAWQAQAWLEGFASIRYPVAASAAGPGNAYFNDVVPILDASGAPTGRGWIPFPPLPALVLLPLVAVAGLAVDQQLVGALAGALGVALAFWVLGRLTVRPALRTLLTVFVGTGTALWYAASIGTTWYLAHVIALGLGLAAVGLALDADAAEAARPPGATRRGLDGRQVAAGLLLGLAATSRLPMVLGLPFFVLVGGGGSAWRRGAAALLGAAVPVAALVAYTQLTTGSPFNPAYEALYRLEIVAYPDLGYNAAWALEDLRYLPGNLGLMLGGLPAVMPPCDPGAVRTAWSPVGCSWLVPEQRGMSLLLTSPACLLALPALGLRDRRAVGAVLATVAIATANLAHFSQGWVQFGYRFSLDFAPFLLVAVALGAERLLGPRGLPPRAPAAALVVGLVVASAAVQAWGIAWARTLGW